MTSISGQWILAPSKCSSRLACLPFRVGSCANHQLLIRVDVCASSGVMFSWCDVPMQGRLRAPEPEPLAYRPIGCSWQELNTIVTRLDGASVCRYECWSGRQSWLIIVGQGIGFQHCMMQSVESTIGFSAPTSVYRL